MRSARKNAAGSGTAPASRVDSGEDVPANDVTGVPRNLQWGHCRATNRFAESTSMGGMPRTRSIPLQPLEAGSNPRPIGWLRRYDNFLGRTRSDMTNRDPAALKALSAGRLPPDTATKGLPRLRFDRVAQRVVRSLQEALVSVPSDKTALVVTVTAPIRLPGRTVGELGASLHRSLIRNFDKMVCGNRVRARLVRRDVEGGPRVIVFIHNPEPAPTGLFKLVEASLYPVQKYKGSPRSRLASRGKRSPRD